MRKRFTYIVALFVTLFLLYTIAWFILAITVATTINKQYANKKINIDLNNASDLNYYVKFAKISFGGFPFKLVLKINSWKEEEKNTLIEFQSPINIDYDLIEQSAFYIYFLFWQNNCLI